MKENLIQKGFFTQKNYLEKRANPIKNSISKDPCEVCGLYKKCKSPKMRYTGEGKKKILIIGEAQGKDEDENWEELGYDEPTQFIGKAGKLLRRKTKPHDIDIDRDCWKTNALICRPPGNKKPTKKQLKCCKKNLTRTIEKLKPEFIWLLGGSAVESFYMDRFSNLGITRWRRLCIPDKTSGAWVIPLFHPSYLLRNEHDKNLDATFDRDLEWAVKQLERKPPIFEDFESQVTLLYEAQDIIEFLQAILKEKPLIAFDYETSALKPYLSHVWVDRHKIWTVSINGTAFPYDYPQDSKYITWSKGAHRKIKKLLQRILLNPKIKKVAHNLKFEDMWSKEILKVNPTGWEACTMNDAHIIDDRPYFTGLKFQAYINYGIEGYEKEVKSYLRNKPGTPFNRLDEMSLDKLLMYNALDSLLTLKLHYDQQKILSENGGKRKEASIFFREGLIAFSNSQHQGIGADFNYYVKQEEILEKEIKKSETKILNGKEAKLFKKKMGEPLKIESDISTKDLRVLLFDIMKLKPVKLTAKAQVPAVDHETLTKIDTQFTKRIIKRRKLVKLKNTYCKRFIRDIVNNRIRPFFDLHTTRSYRSSSDFQQNPKRDEEAKKIVRTGIKPSPGNKLGFFDYGSQEVRIAACITKDPVLIKYIHDPTTDMHRDEAMEIFMLDDKQVTKDIRFYAKNQFVFPEFYGSWYKACAPTLAETCFELETNDNISVVEHLNSNGITCYKDFENHVKRIEKKFWDKYHVYQEWKDRTVFDYHKKGYVELITGFRRGGYLTNNQLLNTPIQGPAFHCLLWSYIQLDKYFKKMRTKLVGQIHDELLEDIYPPEEEEVVSTTVDIMNRKLREHWDWIIVPLEIEPEFTDIDGNWYDIK